MSTPKQQCPKCGCPIGALLYCTPLEADEYHCPSCGLKIQARCNSCGTWLTVIESRCSKCGTANLFFREKGRKS